MAPRQTGQHRRRPPASLARNLELYPLFVGADVDFIIGGPVAQIPNSRPRLKDMMLLAMVLAGRYDRALYRPCNGSSRSTRRRSAGVGRSGSFSHVEEPDAVFALVRDFTGQPG